MADPDQITHNEQPMELPERRYSTEKVGGFSTIPPVHLRNNFLTADFPTVTHTPESLHKKLLCGPLLRYTGTDYRAQPAPVWKGSVLAVTTGVGEPVFTYEGGRAQGAKIHDERSREFWRFMISVPLEEQERKIEYTLNFAGHGDVVRSFWVPGRDQTMRIMVGRISPAAHT